MFINFKYNTIIVFFIINVFITSGIFSNKLLAKEKLDKELFEIYLVIDPEHDDPSVGINPDGKLTFIKNGRSLSKGEIRINSCLLIDLVDQYKSGYFENYYNAGLKQLFWTRTQWWEEWKIENLAESMSFSAKETLKSFAKDQNVDIDSFYTHCEYEQKSEHANLEPGFSDLILIPRYLLHLLKDNNHKKFSKINKVVLTYKFDEIKKITQEVPALYNEIDEFYLTIKEYYINASSKNDKSLIGGLYLKTSSTSEKMNYCTLNYSDEDYFAMRSYRFWLSREGSLVLGDRKLVNWINRNKISLTLEKNFPFFYKKFENLDESFFEIKKNYKNEKNMGNRCNFFIDYPYNIIKLQKAFATDGIEFKYLAVAAKVNDINDIFSKNLGFENYNHYKFSKAINANLNELNKFKKFKILDLNEYNKIKYEIKNISYSEIINNQVMLLYLNDKKNALQKNMNVIEYRNQRVEKQKKQVEIERKHLEQVTENFNQQFPFVGLLRCSLDGVNHTNIFVCFSGGKYGSDTDLVIKNGNSTKTYKVYNLLNVGKETRSGFIIDLEKNFFVKAQNASQDLILTLEIYKRSSEKKIFSQNAGIYDLVYYSQ
jgi:hypothetical protein